MPTADAAGKAFDWRLWPCVFLRFEIGRFNRLRGRSAPSWLESVLTWTAERENTAINDLMKAQNVWQPACA